MSPLLQLITFILITATIISSIKLIEILRFGGGLCQSEIDAIQSEVDKAPLLPVAAEYTKY